MLVLVAGLVLVYGVLLRILLPASVVAVVVAVVMAVVILIWLLPQRASQMELPAGQVPCFDRGPTETSL
jgi:hypothetical protein